MLALDLDTLFSFFGVSVLLALAPGPDNLFVLMQAATHGRRAGMAVVLGLCTGVIGHTLAVAAGLAALVAASGAALMTLKVMGAMYLLYLARGAWLAAGAVQAADVATYANSSAKTTAPRWFTLYRRGIVMNLTNPKVLLFFLAFFPQFVSLAHGSPTVQIVTLGAFFMLATLLVFGAVAFFSGLLGERLMGSACAQRWLNRSSSVVFVGLALRLLWVQA